jgi:methyl-accepting chemotaxis protein
MTNSCGQVKMSAKDLSRLSEQLKALVNRFKV